MSVGAAKPETHAHRAANQSGVAVLVREAGRIGGMAFSFLNLCDLVRAVIYARESGLVAPGSTR